MAAQYVATANSHEGQSCSRPALLSSFTNLRMQNVIVMKIDSCSADVHKDLAHMSLKLKLRMSGYTYLKSKAGKISIGADNESRIKFDSMDGSAIYEGGELFQFELCRVGLFSSSRTLASCAVSALKVFASIGNKTAGADLNLKLVAWDTSRRVLANLKVHMSFQTSTLHDVGGSHKLRLLKLPAHPAEDSEEICDYIHRAQGVADRLQAIHDLTVEAMALRARNAP